MHQWNTRWRDGVVGCTVLGCSSRLWAQISASKMQISYQEVCLQCRNSTLSVTNYIYTLERSETHLYIALDLLPKWLWIGWWWFCLHLVLESSCRTDSTHACCSVTKRGKQTSNQKRRRRRRRRMMVKFWFKDEHTGHQTLTLETGVHSNY